MKITDEDVPTCLLKLRLQCKLVPVILGMERGGGLFWLRFNTSRISLLMAYEGELSALSSLPRARWLFQPQTTFGCSQPRCHARRFELCLEGWGGRACSEL